MPRSPLTEVIKRAEGMVHYVQENLSAEEYALFLDMIDPLPEPEQKRAKKKSSKPASKSTKPRRTSGIGEQIQRRTRQVVSHGGEYCVAQIDDNGGLIECGEAADHNIHHLKNYPDFHPFIRGAQPAEPPSTPVSSGIETGDAEDVHHAATRGAD